MSVLGAGPSVASAQTPSIPAARATVFIRLVGDIEVVRPADAFGPERRVERANVQLSTGSGAVISPVGHVLTAAHVVSFDNGPQTVNGVRVDVKATVRRIDVLLPPDESGSAVAGPLEATVLAVDPALDLAVLTVNGANLPFIDLGDSEALVVGDAVEAVGFPFGEQVEIGGADSRGGAPAPSVSRGNLAAFRGDDQGDRRYLQLTASLNPGNSGGPVVDADGYLVGVANSVMRSRAGVGAGVGFGVSVNVVKRFLELHAIDGALRARRMAAGPPSTVEGKGMRVAFPVGMGDTSTSRTRVDTGSQSADGVVLRIDRVLSPWPLARLAQALTSGRAFEGFSADAGAPRPTDAAAGRTLTGRANGTLPDGTAVRMEYAVTQAGEEKLVARVIGPAYQLAFNASVIRATLRQLEADALRAPGRGLDLAATAATWAARNARRGTPLDGVMLPAGWLIEAVGPIACTDLAPPVDAVSASPAVDFAVALRAGWIPSPGLGPQQAAAACGTPSGEEGVYARDFTYLGTRYIVQGRFSASGGGLLQLESVAPSDQAPALRALFSSWKPVSGTLSLER